MKFTLSWLKEYLDTQASLEEICEKLTNIGLEVESIEDKAKSLSSFSVAQIIEAIPHKNSKKLKICKVETANSKEPLQIICGAANARTGLKVAYAPIGSVIPTNGMTIKKAKIAGVESSGMLCSASELGLGEDSDGIIEIEEKWPIGTKIPEIYNLDDALIEINVTPNRGDCLGILGIARDLVASGIGEHATSKIKQVPGKFKFPLKITNTANEACPYVAFRYIKGVKNSESPEWLKKKLESIGINSISTIVDITNYVMFSLNRPMHAYDAKKIDSEINIRFAKNGEKFTSLKDLEYELSDQELLIADKKKAVGLAGIIGSQNSTCELDTTDIILEAAFFDPSKIADSGRKLNILSDARYRFERGVDETTCESGINLATQLILSICDGEVSEVEFVGQKSENKKIEYNLELIKKLIGIEVDYDTAYRILLDLDFIVEKKSQNQLLVEVPSHRHDVTIAQDLVEEIIRIYGYDKIQNTSLDKIQENKSSGNILHKTRSLLASKGMIETISWSFINSDIIDLFAEKKENLTISNPISVEMDHMRPTLAIGLIESYKKNYLRNNSNLSLFEIGNIFEGIEPKDQKLMVSGIRAGKNIEQNHYHNERDFDVFDVKKDLFDVVSIFGLNPENLQIETNSAPKYYHPHRCATLKLGKNIVGYIGEIHPAILKKFDIKTRINCFEIFFETLPKAQKTNRKAYTQSDLPIVERDFAFLVSREEKVGGIIKTIKSADKNLIKNVDIFDIYSGENIDKDKQSIALRIKIQPTEKTLNCEEIDSISNKVIESVSKSHNATLRSS